MSAGQVGRIGLVLGGGGLKGFAHIGVLQALDEAGVRPAVIAGTSIGALVGAAYAAGMSTVQMAERARAFQRRDLFRLNHMGMLLDRMRSPSIYLDGPLRETVQSVVPHVRFDDLQSPLLVNTVDLERGTQVVWGLPGLTNAYVDDAVYASCALPGSFPPGAVGGRLCIDGGTLDNLPVAFPPMIGADLVIGVDVGSEKVGHATDAGSLGFAAVYMRAATVMMDALQNQQFAARGPQPPLLLVRPRIAHIGWFSFGHAEELIDAGYLAMQEALADLQLTASATTGIFPRRLVQVVVDADKCIGCGTCVALAPRTMALDERRLAYPMADNFVWSPADGDFVRHCPTEAIRVRVEATQGAAALPPKATEPIAVHTEPVEPVPVPSRGPRIKRRARGGAARGEAAD
ncbi:MAG TPA: patatin-like phospholipase family protein [Gemmatimonadaceae bacterium]|nr:patatin-like phospholipase family protein [Gemmatimonadaceae bacterium]